MSENKNVLSTAVIEAAAQLVEAGFDPLAVVNCMIDAAIDGEINILPSSPKVEVDQGRLPPKKAKKEAQAKTEAAPALTPEQAREATVARLQMGAMMSDKTMYNMLRRLHIGANSENGLTEVELARIAYKAKMDARSLACNKRRVVNHLPFIRRQSSY